MTPTTPVKTANEIKIPLTMPIENARMVIWQGKGPREPMGQLLDSKQIGYRDLAWAVDGAFNAQVREAARILLANWLGQPATVEKASGYGPEVIGTSKYLREREEDRLAEAAYYTGAGLGIGILTGLWLLLSIITGGFQQLVRLGIGAQILTALIVIGGIAWCVWYLRKNIKRSIEEYRNYRDGREAEEATLEKLRRALDNQWTIFRNVQLPGHKDDIDLVMIGPDGVWTLEIKSYKNPVRLQGAQWEIQKGNWTAMRDNPTNQVTRNAMRLKGYLEQYGIRRYVHGAIVLQGPHPISNFKASENPIWLFNNLEEQVTTLHTNTPPSTKEIGQIVGAMKELKGDAH